MILETRHLRLVAAVAEHGTLTRAGRVLHLTQSGLSRQLLDLETKLGLPLFHRLGKRMVPTPAGERLLLAARRALPQLSDVEEELRRLVALLRSDHPLSAKPFLTAREFADQHLFVYLLPPGENDVFTKLLSPAGVMPRRVSGVQLTEAILELVKGGAGIAVLARWAVAPHLKTGELTAVPLTRRGLERRWRAAMLRQTPLPLHLREFAALLAAGPTVLSRRVAKA